MDAFITDYNAQGIGAKITTAGTSERVADGALADGRPLVTGTQLVNQRAGIVKLQTSLRTELVSGVGTSIATINDAIQVNGSPRG